MVDSVAVAVDVVVMAADTTDSDRINNFLNQISKRHPTVPVTTVSTTTNNNSSSSSNGHVSFRLANVDTVLANIPAHEKPRMHRIMLQVHACMLSLTGNRADSFTMTVEREPGYRYPSDAVHDEVFGDKNCNYTEQFVWRIDVTVTDKTVGINYTQLAIFNQIVDGNNEQQRRRALIHYPNIIFDPNKSSSTIRLHVPACMEPVVIVSSSSSSSSNAAPLSDVDVLLMRDRGYLTHKRDEQRELDASLARLSSSSTTTATTTSSAPMVDDMLIMHGIRDGQIKAATAKRKRKDRDVNGGREPSKMRKVDTGFFSRIFSSSPSSSSTSSSSNSVSRVKSKPNTKKDDDDDDDVDESADGDSDD